MIAKLRFARFLSLPPTAALLFAAALAGCATSPPRAPARFEFAGVHMGMDVRLVIYAASPMAASSAAEAAFGRIAELDARLSDYRPDSEVRQLERRPGEWIDVSPDLFRVLAIGLAVARASDGAFDPTAGPVIRLWREARRTGIAPQPAAIDAALQHVGWSRIELDSARTALRYTAPGMQLDLGGVAKGYILQEALATLRTHGVTSSLVEAGGDIVVGDAPPGRPGWRIATPLATPYIAERAANLTLAALATSGPTAQSFVIDGERHSHIVDPATGQALTSRWVGTAIHEDAAVADALATALSILGEAGEAKLAERFPGALLQAAPVPPSLP